MRITTQTINNTILTNLNNITTGMAKLNAQISSGNQMATISDNPVNMVTALILRTNLTQITNYQNNLSFGNTAINAAENSLTQMKDLAMQAKTLAIQQVNASVSPENRASAAQQVNNLWQEAITLANSQVAGQYVFGGYRTTGYTAAEPAPFIADMGSGYQVNGSSMASMNTMLTGTVDNTPPANLIAGDVRINGTDIGPVTLNVAASNGLNMAGANNLATAINTAVAPAVTAKLTTLYGGAAATGAAVGETMTQSINGVNFNVVVPNGATPNNVAVLTTAAINAISDQTGVSARVGNGSNGGIADSVVLYNAKPGDGTSIVVGALTNTAANTGLVASTYNVGAGNNTGQISLSSTNSLAITTSAANDTILNRIGLGGGNKGFDDVAGDGTLRYSSALTGGELSINGTPIGATVGDGLSSIYADASAAAKAKAINDLTGTTGVTADITPAHRTASASVGIGSLGQMRSGDLVINGVNIFDGSSTTNANPATITSPDTDNTILNAINAKTGSTGVLATRDSNGILTLTAKDGRNLQIQTSANGENITHLNGAPANTPASTVYFGTVRLSSTNQFFVQTTPTGSFEPGLDALGLGGGSANTGESNDLAGDGQLQVVTIRKDTGNVRYAGDPNHDLTVMIGSQSTLSVAKNGQAAVADTGIFTTLKQFENALNGVKFSTVTGTYRATDINATLGSGTTGLEQADTPFSNGAISVTVTDNSYSPPRNSTMDVGVNTTTDSPASIAAKINGIPGMTAAWNADGTLKLQTSDTTRYSFTVTDTSNFLAMAGITNEQMQVQAINKSIGDFDTVMNNVTNQVSDFGARSNRITVQQQIYSNLGLSTKSTLSDKEDTDLTQAVMDLQSKTTAYQAALSAAAKTMRLSLVDFLK